MSEETEVKAPVELNNTQKLSALQDTAEYAALLNAHGKTYLDSKEGELGRKYTGQALNMIDRNLMAALGMEEKDKPKGKTGDWINSIALENVALKAKLAKGSESSEEANEGIKQLHGNQVAAMQKQLDEFKAANVQLSLDSQNKDVSNALALGLQDATFDPMYSEKVLKQLISSRKTELLANHKFIDGKAIFYREDGTIFEHANGLPMSAKEVANEAFKDLYKSKKAGGGAEGSDSDGTAISVVKGDILRMQNTSSITNYVEFSKEFTKGMGAKGWASHEERTIKLKRATQAHYFPDGLPMG